MSSPKKLKAGIWLRVSTEEQAKGESPAHHEARGRQYAEFKDWEVSTIYHLEGFSGKAVMGHPETKRMLQDVKNGKIDVLIFSKLARLARNTKELLEISEHFLNSQASLVSLQEAIDTSSPAGRLFFTVTAALCQFELEEISDRVKASVPIRAQLGKPLGGAAPYGYRWNDKRLEIEPKEATIREYMFRVFSQHKRKGKVAEVLNSEGYRTRNGGLFTDTTITRLLTDPIAKGMRRANYTQSEDSSKSWKLKPKEEWVFTEAPAIVSPELWDEVNRIIEEQAPKDRRPAKLPVHIFTGHVFCECGEKMYVLSKTNKYVCRGCKNKIPVDDLEGVFVEELCRYIENMPKDGSIERDVNQAIEEKQSQLDVLMREERSLQSKIDSLLLLHESGQIPTDGFGVKYEPLYEQLQAINARIPQLQLEIDSVRMNQKNAEVILSDAEQLYQEWEKYGFAEKRAILESVLDRITVGKSDELEIKLHYLSPSVSELFAHSPHNHKDALGICEITLRGCKPKSKAYPKELRTIGDHIRAVRLDRCMSQPEVARIFGTSTDTVTYWENNRHSPQVHFIPRIYNYLGYNPILRQRTYKDSLLWRELQ